MSIGKGKMKPFLMWVLVPVTVYLAFLFYLYLSQSHMLYFPVRQVSRSPAAVGLDYEEVALVTADGLTLSAWFVPAEQRRGVLLFCHGNAGNISHRLDSIRIFHQIGLDVLIFDYRGYGQSDGNPSEQGTYLDVEAAWSYLVTQRQVDPGDVVLFGRSLGGPVAAWLAQEHNPGALILESTFTSAPDLGAKLYPYVPVRLLLRYKYNTLSYLSEVRCPVLVVHSRDDELIPFQHGVDLYEAAPGPKSFLEIRGPHNEGFIVSGKLYQDGLEDALQVLLCARDAN
jgi:fermentation-respiration switch protein FrsA (DUF1100 family)